MDSKAIIHKTREDYNLVASHFSATRYELWEWLKPFKKLVKDGQNILDWGCGNGRLIALFENKKIKYFGLDQSEGLLKCAKEKWDKEIKEGKVNFFSTAKREKTFDKDFFDLAFLIASFHHLPDDTTRLDLLNKIHTELKPKGKIIITVWNLESDWAERKLKKDWEKMNANDFLVPWHNNDGQIMVKRYYHHFSEAELKSLLQRAGFKNIKLSYESVVKSPDKKGSRNLVAVATK